MSATITKNDSLYSITCEYVIGDYNGQKTFYAFSSCTDDNFTDLHSAIDVATAKIMELHKYKLPDHLILYYLDSNMDMFEVLVSYADTIQCDYVIDYIMSKNPRDTEYIDILEIRKRSI